MRGTRDLDAPKQGANFSCFGVMELRRVSYGKTSHWGGTCARFIGDKDLLQHLPKKKREDRGRIRLKVILNIHPLRAERLGFGQEEGVWALVRVYAINAAQATVFAELVKYLPNGNPWIPGRGYEYNWLSE